MIHKTKYNFLELKNTKVISGVVLILLFLCFPFASQAQLYADHEENFAYEVKQIDEFFERFNNENTLIKRYLSNHYSQLEVSREELLKSLFNFQSPYIRPEEALRFIEQVHQQENPLRLSFYDDKWFAKVKASVLYEGKERELFLLMSVQEEQNGGSKWVIEEVFADFLLAPAVKDSTAFLNPMSHATDFMGLNKVFENPEKVKGYLSSDYQDDQLPKLVMELQNKKVSFREVEDISYHFLQVDGWIFTVEDFQRQEKNAGWLINRLMPANATEKKAYMETLLQPEI